LNGVHSLIRHVRYIVAQIFGAYFACLLVYAQYKDLIEVSVRKMHSWTLTYIFSKLVDEELAAKGLLETIQFTPNGTGGILALYAPPGANLARTFLNEFVSVSPDSPATCGCC
jgi:glycerol uptake facilitator-like aquaporin